MQPSLLSWQAVFAGAERLGPPCNKNSDGCEADYSQGKENNELHRVLLWLLRWVDGMAPLLIAMPLPDV
jgi:hypothetical protein